jgi:hypothetical protein
MCSFVVIIVLGLLLQLLSIVCRHRSRFPDDHCTPILCPLSSTKFLILGSSNGICWFIDCKSSAINFFKVFYFRLLYKQNNKCVKNNKSSFLLFNHRFGKRSPGQCHDDGGAEDVVIGQCMERLGVVTGDSRDSLGRSRFHCFNPETHLFGGYPDWYRSYDKYGARKVCIFSLSNCLHWLLILICSPTFAHRVTWFV